MVATAAPTFRPDTRELGYHRQGDSMGKPRILWIEDERGLIDAVKAYFDREGYETIVVHEGTEGLRKAQTLLPDLVLLDIMLPGMSGLEICQELRTGDRTRDLPIIMLTARSNKGDEGTLEGDQIEGYAKGADLYVTKPFSNKVLVQQVKALLRRSQGASEPGDVVEHQGVRIDRTRHRVTMKGEELSLTPTEFRLIECLVRQPGRAFARRDLMNSAIGDGSIVLERTIDVHIKSLRKKLGEAGELIETVRGVGYRFHETRLVSI
jgi:two-component system, OmpR family, phosphate regulon response regulator PhoB